MVSTIGYERASLVDFVATLQLSKIDVLVDIRDRAQSRRPGFSKTALAAALNEVGIEYIHMKELGDPKEGRDAARRGDYNRFRAIFSNVMMTEAAEQAIMKLEDLANNCRICLMCFERDQRACHRKIVADKLAARGNINVEHLGVKDGAGRRPTIRRMHDLDQGAAASV
jgi:uncharacterized protein (DUF488 family)